VPAPVEFAKSTGTGGSTYFNLKMALKTDGLLSPLEVPGFTLTGRPPEVPDLEAEAKAAPEADRCHAKQKRLEQQEEQEYRDLENKFFSDDVEDDTNNDD
jgi:hypothetical protein